MFGDRTVLYCILAVIPFLNCSGKKLPSRKGKSISTSIRRKSTIRQILSYPVRHKRTLLQSTSLRAAGYHKVWTKHSRHISKKPSNLPLHRAHWRIFSRAWISRHLRRHLQKSLGSRNSTQFLPYRTFHFIPLLSKTRKISSRPSLKLQEP